jgi:hypothetical protein
VRFALLLLIMTGACAAQSWTSLFDGKGLGSWKESGFSGHGPVVVTSVISLGAGQPLTGITWSGEFPRTGYEIRYSARRVRGGDFFASLTFPVGDSHCTFVTGGWGGDIVGLSSIDGWDASDNETRTYAEFESGRWYSFRIRVTADRLAAWIDERAVADVDIRGRKIGLRRRDLDLSTPLGFASYNTTGELRNIEYRLIR